MRKKATRTLVLLIWLFPFIACADQIPPAYFNTVVAVGRTASPAPGQPPQWITEASGFLYGYLITNDPDPLKRKYFVCLVTNRHVLLNHTQIEIRLNPDRTSDKVKSFTLPIKDAQGKDLAFSHPDPNVDVSIYPINEDYLRQNGLQSVFIQSDTNAANKARLKDLGTSAGDGVYILGFPMGLSGAERNYVITRKGSIARISDYLDGTQPTFLIDALIFPGNSGGPVFSSLEVASIVGTKSQNNVLLIGIVRAYIPYTDVAISQQTLQPRVVFEENSGLADVVPVDRIDETIQAFINQHPPEVVNKLQTK